MRVVEPHEGAGLLLEAAEELGVVGQIWRDGLDGDVYVLLGVPSSVNDAHATTTELAVNSISACYRLCFIHRRVRHLGDQAGFRSAAGLFVKLIWPLPSAFMT